MKRLLPWHYIKNRNEWRLYPTLHRERKKHAARVGKTAEGYWVAIVNPTSRNHENHYGGSVSTPFATVEEATFWVEKQIEAEELKWLFP